MRLIDIVITIVCGEALAIVLADFLKEYGTVSEVILWALLFILPVLAIIVLWLVDRISKKALVIFQAAKYILIGTLATLIDLEVFNLLIWSFGLQISLIVGVSKGISFLISVSAKFVGNKYWVFEEKKKAGIKEEFLKFLTVTFIGLVIDIGFFFYFSKILGPQFGVDPAIWVKISVILAAIASALWNFLTYKFIVFKKKDVTSPIS